MPSFLRRLGFAWDYFVRGRHRLPEVVLPDFGYDLPDEKLMRFLSDGYEGHGAEPVRIGNWIFIAKANVLSRAAWFPVSGSPGSCVIQVDFITVCDGERHIIESFAGFGADHASALKDACKGFMDSSFHVLLSTVCGQPCDHVDREIWTIGGREKHVTLGWLRKRGHTPLDEWPSIFTEVQRQVEEMSLSQGLHWMRYFYSHTPGEEPTIEVLLDNEPHGELQGRGAGLPWPQTDTFYSIRLFFVIQDA